MITTFILLTGGLVLTIIVFALQLITFVIPTEVTETLNYGFSKIGFLQGWLPLYADSRLDGLAASFGIIDLLMAGSTIIATFYTFKLLMRVLGMIPWINVAMFDANKIRTTTIQTGGIRVGNRGFRSATSIVSKRGK